MHPFDSTASLSLSPARSWLALALLLPLALATGACSSQTCQLTIENGTGFDLTLITLAGADIQSSATAKGATHQVEVAQGGDSVDLGASDSLGRTWSGASTRCPAGESASFTLGPAHRSLTVGQCTVDLINASGTSVDWYLAVSGNQADSYDESLGDSLADGASVLHESVYTSTVYARGSSSDGREWEAEVANCAHGELVTITFDEATEIATFDCGDGTFVVAEWVCDGGEDCGNGADEADCPTCNLNVTNSTSQTLVEIEAWPVWEDEMSLAPGSSHLLTGVRVPAGEQAWGVLYAYSDNDASYLTEFTCTVDQTVQVELTDGDWEYR